MLSQEPGETSSDTALSARTLLAVARSRVFTGRDTVVFRSKRLISRSPARFHRRTCLPAEILLSVAGIAALIVRGRIVLERSLGLFWGGRVNSCIDLDCLFFFRFPPTALGIRFIGAVGVGGSGSILHSHGWKYFRKVSLLPVYVGPSVDDISSPHIHGFPFRSRDI